MKVEIVVGANYGDEGKGLVSNSIASSYARDGQKVLNVLYNGGCQRGHTVDILKTNTIPPTEAKHVFHHFGSGTIAGADNYFHKDFLINPIFFNEELKELLPLGGVHKVYIDPRCRVVTPYDMILNQMIEENRGEGRHGSCGFGIFETIKRYETSPFNWTYDKIFQILSKGEDRPVIDYLNDISKIYLYSKIKEYGIRQEIVDKYAPILTSYTTIRNWITDFQLMMFKAKIVSEVIMSEYDVVLFEAGQGLALDMDLINITPHLTPSHTGSVEPIRIIKNLWDNGYLIERPSLNVNYVTRSYFTRHGAGPLPTECKREDLNSQIEDLTNVPNSFQGAIRYGRFNKEELLGRVQSDIDKGHLITTDFETKRNLWVTWSKATFSEDLEDVKYNSFWDEVIEINDKYGFSFKKTWY